MDTLLQVRPLRTMPHLSHSFSGALRTFAYFMSSGTHYMLEGVDYLPLYGSEPSAIEQAYAIFANVVEVDERPSAECAARSEEIHRLPAGILRPQLQG